MAPTVVDMSANPIDFTTLIARARAGERAAFDALIDCTARDVTSFVAARVSAIGLIDEIVQDAFRNLANLENPESFAAWVKGIARHRLLRLMQERRRRADDLALDAVIADLQVAPSAEEPGESDLTERIARLQRCLARLDPRARQLVASHWADEVPINRLAQRYKRTVDSLSSALSRLRQQLRRCVANREVANGKWANGEVAS